MATPDWCSTVIQRTISATASVSAHRSHLMTMWLRLLTPPHTALCGSCCKRRGGSFTVELRLTMTSLGWTIVHSDQWAAYHNVPIRHHQPLVKLHQRCDQHSHTEYQVLLEPDEDEVQENEGVHTDTVMSNMDKFMWRGRNMEHVR